MDSGLAVGPSQIEGGNVAPLRSAFPQFLGTNVHVGHIYVYKVIQFSVVHDWSHFPLILLHYCHQRNQSLRQVRLLLWVQHKPAVRYPELQFISYLLLIFSGTGYSASLFFSSADIHFHVAVHTCLCWSKVVLKSGSFNAMEALWDMFSAVKLTSPEPLIWLLPASQSCQLLAGGQALTRFGVQSISPWLLGICCQFSTDSQASKCFFHRQLQLLLL